MGVTQRIKEYGYQLGFDHLGITHAQPFTELLPGLQKRREEGLYSPFAPADLEQTCNPQAILPGAKSFITAGMFYYQGQGLPPGPGRGQLARTAWGQDYHRVMETRLQALGERIEAEIPGSQAISFVDTGPLLDKEVARRAGLGWFGGHSLLVSPCFGSWVFLGGVLTTAQLEPDPSPVVHQGCGEGCDRCRKACPTGALVSPGVLDYKRCLAYLTQAKGYLPREFRKVMGRRLYGCDTCQESCPFNGEVPISQHREFFPEDDQHCPPLMEVVAMTNRQFKDRFGTTSAGWRGRTVLQRNALVALGNEGDPTNVPVLVAALEDPRPVIRAHAGWALGEIGTPLALQEIKKALARERDPQVREELLAALTGE